MRMLSLILSAVLLAVSTAGCGGEPTPEEIRQTVLDRADEAVLALKNKEMSKLKALIHPDKGVRISPYSHVNAEDDLVFQADGFEGLMSDSTVYMWGHYDGSGEPIRLTFAEFYERFLYNRDYADPEKQSYNEVIGQGNTLNNVDEIYPEGHVVEYHFSGFDPQYAGMDWASLRLVFEEKGGRWYLVAIVRDQWTI